MAKIGTGYISVDADLDPFWRKIESELGGLTDQFKGIGKKSGKAFGDGFSGVGNNLKLVQTQLTALGDNKGLDRVAAKVKDATSQLALFSQGGERAGGQFSMFGDEVGRSAQKATRAVAEAGNAVTETTSKVNAFGRDGTASFSAVGNASRSAGAELKSLYADITRSNISRALGDAGTVAGKASAVITTASRRNSDSLRTVDREARKAAKGFEGLAVAAGGSGGALRGAARTLDGLGGSFTGGVAAVGGLRIALVLLVPALIGFGGAAGAAASALIPLIGLAASGVNAISGLAQAFGVLKLASSGIGAALKEQSSKQAAAGTTAVNSAAQQRSAARAIQSAQDGVRNALRGVADAQRGVSDAARTQRSALAALAPAISAARMQLTDLRLALIDTKLALAGANIAALDARTALSELLNGNSPQAIREVARAHDAIRTSLYGEEQAALSLFDAQKALKDLMEPASALDVADAEDAVADAIRNQERARLNLSDAIKGNTDDLQKAAQERERARLTLTDPRATDEQKEQAKLIIAFKAETKDTARARLELADAENAVGDAQRARQRSEENLKKLQAGPTQDEIAAARRRVTQAEYGVAEAARNTAAAREELAIAEAPASAEDIIKARLAVAVADAAVTHASVDAARAVRESTAAEALGVAGAEGVVAAREAIRAAAVAVTAANLGTVDANRAVIRANQALSDAHLSAAETSTKAAASAVNLNTKLEALPPSAQAFVRQLLLMKPKLDELRETAAAGLFPGVIAGLQAAMHNFGSLNKVVGETSTVMGEAARKTGELIGSDAFGKDFETIGHNNAKVIETLGEALRHVISALRHVMVAAGPLTQWLADVANSWALNAAEAAKAGRESGKMAEFFEKTRAICERLGSIIGHLTHGFLGIGKAGEQTGNDIWASIDRMSKKFDAWANSVEGQKSIHDFFQRTKELAEAIAPVLGGIVQGVGLIVLKFLPLTAALELAGPLADDLTVIFIGLKFAQVGLAAGSAAAGAAIAVATFLTGGWTTAFWALNTAIGVLTAPITLIVLGIAALAAGLIYAYTHSEAFKRIVDGVFSWLKGAATDVFGFLGSFIPDIWNAISAVTTTVWSAIRDILSTVFNAIKDIANTVFPVIGAIITTAWTVVSTVTTTIWNVIKAVLTTVWNAIAAAAGLAWTAIKMAVTTPIEAARVVLAAIWAGISGAMGLAWAGIKLAVTTAWGLIRDGILTPIRAARDLMVEVLTGIGNRLSTAWETIKTGVGRAWDAVRDLVLGAVRGARDLLPEVLDGIWNRLSTGFSRILKGVIEFARDVKEKFLDGVKGGLNVLIGFLRKVIGTINKVLDAVGVGEIGMPDFLAEGGTYGEPEKRARGGAFGRTGGFVGAPMTLMGEEAPRHPEYVIPTNPAYRDRAKMLLAQAAGAIGYAEGGVISAFKTAISQTGAGPKAALALFEAGIVESGLRNLSYGDRDSVGALQQRPSQGWTGLMNPLKAAIEFLRSAIPMSNAYGSAGQLAQAVQRSAYPERYDQVRDQAMQYISGDDGGGGGILSKIGDAVGGLLSGGLELILGKLPGVGELPDWLRGVGTFALDAIKDYVKGLVGMGGEDGASGPGVMTGTNAKAAELARRFNARITSNYRTPAQNAAAGGAPGSSHMKGSPANPGAHDFVPASAALLQAATKMGAKWVDNHDYGSGLHSHVSWFRKGGMYGPHMGAQPILGSYAGGTPYVPQNGIYELHRGEAVTPAGQNTPMIVHVYVGDREITDIVDVQIETNGRRQAGAWKAGAR